MREGYRNTIDSRFLEYVKGCQQNNIPILGVYHFVYSTDTASVKKEAQTAVQNVQSAGLPQDTRIWCDIEYDTIDKAKAKGIIIGPAEVDAFTKVFCKEIERLGYLTGIYCNVDFYHNYYDKKTVESYPIWLADLDGNPDVECMIHQYSFNGKIDGISGKVDMDVFFESDELFSDGQRMLTKDEAVQMVINEATYWEGYKEKASASQLESFTGNAGSGNYTIFGKTMHDLYPAVMDYPAAWCDCFIDYVFMRCFGPTDAKKILCGDFDDYTVYSAKYYKDKGRYFKKAEMGDQIFFKNSSGICHTGLVIAVDSNWIYTIEGNSGNKVAQHAYRHSDSTIDGFGRPDWDVVAGKVPYQNANTQSVINTQTEVKKVMVSGNLPMLKTGNTGIAVVMLQTMLGVTADGVFGSDTKKALKAFQKNVGIDVDGVCGSITWGKVFDHMTANTK